MRRIARAVAAAAIVAVVVLFFRNEFAKNWSKVQGIHFNLNYFFLALSLLAIMVSYLLNTYTWRYCVNLFAGSTSFSFTECIGIVNTTQLTKYIPGKVWGYAMQMLLINRKSIPVSALLYINLFLALMSAFTCLLLGGVYFIISSHLVPRLLCIAATSALLLLYGFFLLFNGKFFALVIRAIERISKKTIAFCEMHISDIIRMQIVSLVLSITFGTAAWYCSIGLGFTMQPRLVYAIISGFLFSDTVGFLVFLVPGGIGVREGVFYMILREHGAESIALILPIVLRLISMMVDVILGVLGMVFLRKYIKKGAQ